MKRESKYCLTHDEHYNGDRCLRCIPLSVLEKRKVKEPAKPPESVTHDQVKESVKKVSKLRAGKHQLTVMMRRIRAVIEEEAEKCNSITYAEIVGVLDKIKSEWIEDWDS